MHDNLLRKQAAVWTCDGSNVYVDHFPLGFMVGPIKETPVARLRHWLDDGNLSKPLNRFVRA